MKHEYTKQGKNRRSGYPLLSDVKRLKKDLDNEFIISLLQGIESNCEDDYTKRKVKKHINVLINAEAILGEVIKRIAE